jgi:hypothetical protein
MVTDQKNSTQAGETKPSNVQAAAAMAIMLSQT